MKLIFLNQMFINEFLRQIFHYCSTLFGLHLSPACQLVSSSVIGRGCCNGGRRENEFPWRVISRAGTAHTSQADYCVLPFVWVSGQSRGQPAFIERLTSWLRKMERIDFCHRVVFELFLRLGSIGVDYVLMRHDLSNLLWLKTFFYIFFYFFFFKEILLMSIFCYLYFSIFIFT